MKTILNAVAAAFSTFSVIPMPKIQWSEKGLKGILPALPLVGAFIGGAGCLYFYLAGLLELPWVLSAVVLTVLPVVLSGGIHMDGFADTIDALKSHADPEKKRGILKDPHSGAFAIIGIACYILLYFGIICALLSDWKTIGLLGITQVLARTVGALLSVILPSSHEGMLRTFNGASEKASIWILAVWGALSVAGACVLSPLSGCTFAGICVAVFFAVRHTALKQFCGMSGDIAGYSITIASGVLAAGLLICERIVSIWF